MIQLQVTVPIHLHSHSQCYFFCEEDGCRKKGQVDSEAARLLQEMLPEEFQHIVCSCKGLPSDSEFETTFRINLSTMEEAESWRTAFNLRSKTTLRVLRKLSSLGTKVLYKVQYRCQHNTRPCSSTADERTGSKNTNCPLTAKLTVHTTERNRPNGYKRKIQSSDPHLPEYPTLMSLSMRHNHPLEAASAMKHRDVSEDTRQKIEDLILQGYPPSQALEVFKMDLQLKDPDNYVYISGDRAQCPDKDYVYRLYYQLCKQRFGNSNSKGSDELKEFVEKKNDEFVEEQPPTAPQGQRFISMDSTTDGQTVVAICTPMMHRVHHLIKHSGELVFIDATGCVDRNDWRVFLLLTHSCIGGLPLGALITTSESQITIEAALSLLKDMVGDTGFYGRGQLGPEIFMTDDSRAEQAALKAVFPGAKRLLCAFHILQAFWRHVWDCKQGIPLPERPPIFSLVKDMLYAEDQECLMECYNKALNDTLLVKYPKTVKYIKALFERREQWAICFRNDLLVRGNHTNNFCEIAMRVLKEQILHRTKAFNVQHLVDFMCTRLELYYQRRYVDIANNVLQRVRQSKYLPSDKVDPKLINRIDETNFDVQSTEDPSQHYRVDMSVGLCTCKVGKTGGPCKHQASISSQFGIRSWNFIPAIDAEMRQLLCEVGTGQSHPLSWFHGLKPAAASIPAVGPAASGEPVSAVEDRVSLEVEPLSESVEPVSESVSNPCPLDTSKLLSDWDNFARDVRSKLLQGSEEFGPAVARFMEKANKMKTDTQLISAFHRFGDNLGHSSSTGHIMSTKRIPVQPTALQRRKRVLAGGRCLGAGRPAKSSVAGTDGEVQHTLSGGSLPKRKKAPHSLSQCIKENKSLGKRH